MRFIMLGGGILAASVLASACASASPSDPASTQAKPSTSRPPSTTSPGDLAQQQAIVAYLGMWQDFVLAGHTADWQSPALAHHATGIALTNLSRGLYADHYNDLVTKGEPTLRPGVTSADPPSNPTKIIITDCGDSTHWLKYRADNGQLADNTPGGRQLINAIVEKQADGSWKVSDFGVHDVGTC